MTGFPVPAFSVDTLHERDVRTIVVRGEIDMFTSPRLTVHLEGAAAASGPVLVDLCGASFLDSSGLYLLLILRQRIAEQSRRMAVACLAESPVAKTLQLSGTDRLLDMHAGRAQALAALSAEAIG